MKWGKFTPLRYFGRFWTHVTNFEGIHRVPKNGEQIFFRKLVKDGLDLPISTLKHIKIYQFLKIKQKY